MSSWLVCNLFSASKNCRIVKDILTFFFCFEIIFLCWHFYSFFNVHKQKSEKDHEKPLCTTIHFGRRIFKYSGVPCDISGTFFSAAKQFFVKKSCEASPWFLIFVATIFFSKNRRFLCESFNLAGDASDGSLFSLGSKLGNFVLVFLLLQVNLMRSEG